MNPDSRAQLFPAHFQFGKATQLAGSFRGAEDSFRADSGIQFDPEIALSSVPAPNAFGVETSGDVIEAF